MGETLRAAEVAARYHDGLYRFAMALARRDREEADEIVQQTYLAVIEGRADLLRADNPRAFLFGVARRVASGRRRRFSLWGRIGKALFAEQALAAPGRPADEAVAFSQSAARLRTELAALPERQLEVVSLVFEHGLTVEEAAAVMGIGVGSARTHYHRAKERLRRMLEDLDVDGARQTA